MVNPYVSQVMLFAGKLAPRDWAFCHGQILPIDQFQELFSIIGTTYGGDGITTFALPDLRGRAPAGIGQGPGLPDMVLGQSGIFPLIAAPTSWNENTEGVPYVGMTWCIATNGDVPSPD